LDLKADVEAISRQFRDQIKTGKQVEGIKGLILDSGISLALLRGSHTHDVGTVMMDHSASPHGIVLRILD